MQLLGHLLTLGLVAAQDAEPRPSPARVAVGFSGPAMGGRYAVQVVMGPDDEAGRERVRAAIAWELELADRLLSSENAASEASRLGSHAVGTPFPVAPETLTLLELARRASELSGGAFGCSRLQLDPVRSTVTRTQVDGACDLSAVASGWTADRIADAVARLGHPDVLAEVGGDVAARGRRADGGRWRVALEWPDPKLARERALPLELDRAAVATCGAYGRTPPGAGGGPAGQRIDPRTGQPVANGLVSVSVVHADGAWARALATALLVLGPDAGRALAARERLLARFVRREPAGGYSEWATPAFEAVVAAGSTAPVARE